jgi:hypothetical protein
VLIPSGFFWSGSNYGSVNQIDASGGSGRLSSNQPQFGWNGNNYAYVTQQQLRSDVKPAEATIKVLPNGDVLIPSSVIIAGNNYGSMKMYDIGTGAPASSGHDVIFTGNNYNELSQYSYAG